MPHGKTKSEFAMPNLDQLRVTLESYQSQFDNEIAPAFEDADKTVQQHGFGSYMELIVAMMELSKKTVSTCKQIKALSTIEDEIEDMDELLKVYEPIVNELLPTVQNCLVDILPPETFEDMEEDKSLEGLVKFMTT